MPKNRAEEIRRELLSKGLLEKHLSIAREGEFVFLPVKERVDFGLSLEERDFPEAFRPVARYSEIVAVPEELKPLLPTALDIVGDIAIIRLPEELRQYGGAMGEAILKTHSHVRCVLADKGVAGEFRVRKVSHLAGEARTRTVHREHGLRYAVDVAKAYFSPRLATERVRVTEQVAAGEVVLDLFTGVGPFAIMIAKKREPSVVHAVDSNPDAFELLQENVRINKAERVRPILSDARAALREIGEVDRLILDLPQSAREFYVDSLRSMKDGGTLHYYEMLETVELEERKEGLVDDAARAGRNIEIAAIREVKTYSPAQMHFAFEVRVFRA